MNVDEVTYPVFPDFHESGYRSLDNTAPAAPGLYGIKSMPCYQGLWLIIWSTATVPHWHNGALRWCYPIRVRIEAVSVLRCMFVVKPSPIRGSSQGPDAGNAFL